MNERILELAKEAGHRYVPSSNTGPLRVEYLTPELEKFAELIVTECMNAVCDPKTTYLESMTESSAMYTARERIREHFRS